MRSKLSSEKWWPFCPRGDELSFWSTLKTWAWDSIINAPVDCAYISWWRHQMEWKRFPRYWPFVRGIHQSPVNSPHKGQWHRALIFSLICALNKRLSKHSWGWWFETPSCSLWRHCNVLNGTAVNYMLVHLCKPSSEWEFIRKYGKLDSEFRFCLHISR